MAKATKNREKAMAKLETGKKYSLKEASSIVKEITNLNFDASVDMHFRLGVDPRKADQTIRGTTTLPHGTGKEKKVLVLCTPDKEEEAKSAGADYAGLDEFVEKIEKGWTEVDVVIATPSVMPKIGKLGKVLGPRNLMPNPKSGTVTEDVAAAVKDVKSGKISFRVDKYGILHASVGRVSFGAEQIFENARELTQTIARMKPASAKGIYFKSVHMVSTMSPGIEIDTKAISTEK